MCNVDDENIHGIPMCSLDRHRLNAKRLKVYSQAQTKTLVSLLDCYDLLFLRREATTAAMVQNLFNYRQPNDSGEVLYKFMGHTRMRLESQQVLRHEIEAIAGVEGEPCPHLRCEPC
jgi:hypothetical protein